MLRGILKPDAVPTVFALNSPPKCRRLSEPGLARDIHKAAVTEILDEKKSDSTKAAFLEPVTTLDVGIQCNKIT